MKEHAKKALKHDVSVAGKTVPTLAIAALFLVGTGSAALLSSFGTVSGEANVQQAVTFSDGDTVKAASFNDTDVTAGTTTTTDFTLHNDADKAATVKLDSGASEIEGISQVVKMESYDQQVFNIRQYGGSEDVDDSSLDVVVTPTADNVTYEADLANVHNTDQKSHGAQLYFNSSHYTNVPHVFFERTGEKDPSEWNFKTKSEGAVDYPDAQAMVDAREALLDASYDSETDTLTVVVDRQDNFNQSFAFVETNGGQAALATSRWAEWGDGEPPSVSLDGQSRWYTDVLHEAIDYETRNFDNPVTVTDTGMSTGSETNQDVALEPNSQTDFRVTTDFHVALDPQPDSEHSTDDGDYLVDLGVEIPSSAKP